MGGDNDAAALPASGAARLKDLVRDAESAFQAGRMQRTISLCTMGLSIDHHHPRLLELLAAISFNRGDPKAAAEMLHRALRRDPRRSGLWLSLGRAFRAFGEHQAAERSFQRAVELDPAEASAHRLLGDLAHDRADHEAAITHYENAAQIRPDDSELQFRIGLALGAADRPEAAADRFRRAAGLTPDNAAVWTNLGVVSRRLGRYDDAVAAHEKAIACQPDHVDAHWNLANALLQTGDLMRGFTEYEWRFRRPGWRRAEVGLPLWDGRAPVDDLLLTAEQGVGDLIQFARYLPDAAARGARLWVECHAGLEPILESLPEVAGISPFGAVPPQAEAYAPLVSLPHILGLNVTRAERLPFVRPPSGPVPDILQASPGLRRIGVVWSGNPEFVENHVRSCHAADLLPLAALADVRLFSLQMGPARDEIGNLTDPAKSAVADLAPFIGDYGDTARILAELDLLVSTDTSVPHLALSMGVPTAVLLSRQADWRWGRDTGFSPWYPDAALFWQKRLGHWDEPVAALCEAIGSGRL